MTIRKNDFIGNLKIPLTELWEVSVILGRGVDQCVRVVGGYELHELLKDKPLKRGVPECASIDNGRLITVFPRTDKRYRLRVVGTQIIEQ